MPDQGDNTPMVSAARRENHFLVSDLLQAGADPLAGHISAIMWINDRILDPEDFWGCLSGIASVSKDYSSYSSYS
jgi:hypothetical protein